ncbi:membrane protein [Kutzneria viridogrisea]|uniref:DUF7144 domain-containing protein n=2 Tax=Kutzneria TaxID=43356 RepID=A0ABR6BYV5_9PSEU|nr:hypothetical protein [Kutzneria albida]AHH96949.1 putative membrane protein [Kutzneria albida DSM 43870]MBA8932086.1 hypothetical protein [Kutzneria viridogrisea]
MNTQENSPRHENVPSYRRPFSPGAGWVWFAAVMMVLTGTFNAVEGLAALFQQRFYVVSPDQLLVLNLTGWGWVHLAVGVLIAAAGCALFTGALWAGVVAVLVAAVNAIVQLAFLAVSPVWSVLIIALNVIVIWALVVNGSEVLFSGGTRPRPTSKR